MNAVCHEESAMNNTSLTSADKNTHLKVVGVALFAGLIVAGIGFAARTDFDSGGEIARVNSSGEILRAGKPLAVTTGQGPAIR